MKKTSHQTLGEAEPECAEATLNGSLMHNLARVPNTGDCLFCAALRSAYFRGVENALDGREGF